MVLDSIKSLAGHVMMHQKHSRWNLSKEHVTVHLATSILSLFLSHHEAKQPCQDGGNGPGRVPGVGVEVTDGEAEASVDLKPAIGGDHDDARGLEGIIFGENQLPVVVAT